MFGLKLSVQGLGQPSMFVKSPGVSCKGASEFGSFNRLTQSLSGHVMGWM